MPGVEGDMVQLVLRGTFEDSVWMNVFFYRVEDDPTAGYLTGLADDFQSVVLDAMADAQTNLVTYDEIRLLNIFSFDELVVAPVTPDDGNVTPSTGAGASFLAADYKLIRSNARVRHGHKFLTGLQESWFEGNDLQPAYITLAAAVETAFAQELVPGLVDRFAPVIVGRVDEGTPPVHGPYRLPESQAEMGTNWAYVTSCVVNPFLTTERLRKLGRGI